jgi:SAM-dependent methyltransferase
MDSSTPRRTCIEVPKPKILPWSQRLARALKGMFLSPVYWWLAHIHNVPGLKFHRYCSQFGLKLLFFNKGNIDYRTLYHLICFPMDSTRYFEFDFLWKALSTQQVHRYLDVSSPRLFPLILTSKKHHVATSMVNPDKADLLLTKKLVAAAALDHRCELYECLIESALFRPNTFDTITSISVIEHIPEDTKALRNMWAMLKHGGRLLVTLPCAAESSEQYSNENKYGLLDPGDDGLTFWQRLYDQKMLNERVYCVTGKPENHMIYGEKTPGSFRRNANSKLSDPHYPFWREPFMMGQEYDYFDSVNNLPGEGVIAMEFVKP